MTTLPTTTVGAVHSGVYRPSMFVCATDQRDSYVLYDARPGAEISAALLDDTGDWWKALRALPDGVVPDGVTAAVEALHEAVCGWSDWLSRTATSPSPTT